MEFKILGVKPTGEQGLFFYDSTNNILKNEQGIVYEDNTQKRNYSNTYKEFDKQNPIEKSNKIKILKIQLGLSCNYSCEYCSQRFVPRAEETNKNDIQDFIDKMEFLDLSELKKVEFWGGEPLVYWKTLKPLAETLRDKFEALGMNVPFTMVTNGSLLTPEICGWLMYMDFFIAISHDGPNQAVRGPDPFDDPELKKTILSFYKVMRKRGKISFNAMLNNSNTSRKQIYEWFVELTGDKNVNLGEGGIVDAYDEGGEKLSLNGFKQHFEFRKTCFNDFYETDCNIGFRSIKSQINDFIDSILLHKPLNTVGQKCGMDNPGNIAVDLKGDVLTCQNVSSVSFSPAGVSHKLGNIADGKPINLNTSTHWSKRDNCSSCPVIHLCKGSCMFLDGPLWHTSCDNAFSDNIAKFAVAFEAITGFIPTFIHDDNLPKHRQDIWGDVLEHKEVKKFPIKVVSA